jgi:predicted nucleic acid-binding protein
MDTIFVDTGYWLALELANDQNHETALRHWHGSVKALPPLVTTSYVFDEVVTFFNNRGHHSKAVQVGNRLLHSPSIQMIHVDEGLFFEGWRLCQERADKSYSLTDCISFIVMKRLGLQVAYTFDQHFAQAGFMKEP